MKKEQNIKEVLQYIEDNYGSVGKVESIKRLMEGFGGHTFCIKTTKGKLFLKQYGRKLTKIGISKTIQIQTFFHNEGFPVIMPLCDTKKHHIFPINGKYYSLFPYVDEDKLEFNNKNKKAIQSMAETLAKMHLASKKNIKKISLKPVVITCSKTKFKKDVSEFWETIKNKKIKIPKKILLDVKYIIDCKQKIVEANSTVSFDFKKYPKHILHGDYHIGNLFFIKKNISHVFDFDYSIIGPRSFDLMVLIFNALFSTKGFEKKTIPCLKLFCKHYDAVYPIDKKEFIKVLKCYLFYRRVYHIPHLKNYCIYGFKESLSIIKIEKKFFQKGVCDFLKICEDIINNFDVSLVDIREVNKNIKLDIRYATKNNFANEKLYSKHVCLLRKEVCLALDKVQKELEKQNLSLIIWDGYRPHRVQEILFSKFSDTKYVAKNSNHSKGVSVDVSLCDKKGKELKMPTDFDDFSEKANTKFTNLTKEKISNRNLLSSVMKKHGFLQNKLEWWHFDFLPLIKSKNIDIDV